METFKSQNERLNFLSVNMEEVIENCLECHRRCLSVMQHCLALGGNYVQPMIMNALSECSEVARVTADCIVTNSEFSHDLASLCARVCENTARKCNELDPEDGHLVTCVLICQQCADSCRNMEH
jgi:hypothetical protein